MEVIVRKHVEHFLKYKVVLQLVGGRGNVVLILILNYCYFTFLGRVLLKIVKTSYNNYIFSSVLCNQFILCFLCWSLSVCRQIDNLIIWNEHGLLNEKSFPSKYNSFCLIFRAYLRKGGHMCSVNKKEYDVANVG